MCICACVQILEWVLSYDGVNQPEPLAITAAAAALLISGAVQCLLGLHLVKIMPGTKQQLQRVSHVVMVMHLVLHSSWSELLRMLHSKVLPVRSTSCTLCSASPPTMLVHMRFLLGHPNSSALNLAHASTPCTSHRHTLEESGCWRACGLHPLPGLHCEPHSLPDGSLTA